VAVLPHAKGGDVIHGEETGTTKKKKMDECRQNKGGDWKSLTRLRNGTVEHN